MIKGIYKYSEATIIGKTEMPYVSSLHHKWQVKNPLGYDISSIPYNMDFDLNSYASFGIVQIYEHCRASRLHGGAEHIPSVKLPFDL